MNIKLSISVLVSDRAETAKKCLHSLLPLLQAVESELIVVYTGREAESLQVAEQYTDHIIPFTWCDDFSAARNAGLKEASGEWFLYIDDDEWFDNCEEMIRFFQSGEYQQYESASYLQRNYSTMSGDKFSDVEVWRMTKRTEQTIFGGIIHEYIRPLRKPVKYFQTFVHHYGYMAYSKSGTRASSERNVPLLLKAIEKEPDDIKNYLQLAQEYYGTYKYEEAVQYCHKVLELQGDKRSVNKCAEWAGSFLVASLAALGKTEEAFLTGIQILDKHYLNQLGSAYLCMLMLPLCNKLKKYEKGIELADLFWKLMDEVDRVPELWNEQQILDITYANIEKNRDIILQNELLCAAFLENYDKAKQYLSRFLWTKDKLSDSVYEFFEDWKGLFSSHEQQLLECFASLSVEDTYIIFQKALLAELNQEEENAGAFYSLCQNTDNNYIRYQVVLMAIRRNYPMPEFIEHLDLDAWKVCADRIGENGSFEDYNRFIIVTELLFYKHPIHRLVLEQKVLPRLLMQSKEADGEFNRMIHRYCQAVIELNRRLYRDELFEEPMYFCLPIECRTAMSIDDAVTLLEQGDYTGGIKALREIIVTYPGLTSLVEKVISGMEKDYLKVEEPKNKEFELLGSQIKLSLKQLMANQQYDAALPIVEKLCELLPEDMEIVKWKQTILQKLK